MTRTQGQQIHGVLKFYDGEKGYGFLACNDGGANLFVHHSAMCIHPSSTLARVVLPGMAVRCTYHARKGNSQEQARNVTNADGTLLGEATLPIPVRHLASAEGTRNFRDPLIFGLTVGNVKVNGCVE